MDGSAGCWKQTTNRRLSQEDNLWGMNYCNGYIDDRCLKDTELEQWTNRARNATMRQKSVDIIEEVETAF